MTLNTSRIDDALTKGYLLATEFADYLVIKGVPFREAHEVTGKTVVYAIDNKKQLEDLSLDEFKQFSESVDEDVYQALTLDQAIAAKNVLGGTAKNQVEFQIKQIGEKYSWNNH